MTDRSIHLEDSSGRGEQLSGPLGQHFKYPTTVRVEPSRLCYDRRESYRDSGDTTVRIDTN